MTLKSRVGVFLIVLSLALLALFFISDLATDPEYNLLFYGLLGLGGGILLARRHHEPPEPSGRFGLIKRLRKRGVKEKAGDGDKENDSNAA